MNRAAGAKSHPTSRFPATLAARLRTELQHTRELLQRADETIEILSQAVRALSPAPLQPQSDPNLNL